MSKLNDTIEQMRINWRNMIRESNNKAKVRKALGITVRTAPILGIPVVDEASKFDNQAISALIQGQKIKTR